ncbi:MAG: hypothetical protein ABSH10_08470 [Phycisphaerae bacterium]|jgi:hypothetical protein
MRRALPSLGWLALLGAAMVMGAAPTSAPTTSPKTSWEAYRLILDRNIFARDRAAPSQEEGDANRSGPPHGGEGSLILTGMATWGNVRLAFFEDSQTGETLKAVGGQALSRGTVISISLDSVEYRSGGTMRRIFIGENLIGQAGTLGSPGASSRPASTTEAAGQSGGTSGKDAGDVLERMRQRRLQEVR